MAQTVTTHLVDDLTGDTIDEGKGRTVTFGFDGSNYEIDLTDDNTDALREAFSDYVAAARKVSGRFGRSSGGSAPKRGNSDELAKIREWAKANGHEVSSRGRISQAVRNAYDAAHWPRSPTQNSRPPETWPAVLVRADRAVLCQNRIRSESPARPLPAPWSLPWFHRRLANRPGLRRWIGRSESARRSQLSPNRNSY